MIAKSVFRKFPNLIDAREMESLLNKHGIETILADNIAPVDLTYSGNTLNDQYEIQIATSDFNKAQKIVEDDAVALIELINSDHYLYEFSNDELYEVLANQDEWHDLDYKLSHKILAERGIKIESEYLEKLKNDRLKKLAKPEEDQKTWIIAGYIFSFLGGIVGIIIGYVLYSFKKTLPNGEKVFAYNEMNRKHGRYIFYIGIIVSPILILLKVFFK